MKITFVSFFHGERGHENQQRDVDTASKAREGLVAVLSRRNRRRRRQGRQQNKANHLNYGCEDYQIDRWDSTLLGYRRRNARFQRCSQGEENET